MKSEIKRQAKSELPSNKLHEGFAWELERKAEALIQQLSNYAATGDEESLVCLKWLARASSREVLNCAVTANPEALKAAIEMVSAVVANFETCCKKLSPDAVKSIARKTDRWPSFYYCHGEQQKKQIKRIGNIGIGKATGINYDGRSFSMKTPGTRIAFELKTLLDQLRGTTDRPIGLSSLSRRRSRGAKPHTSVDRKREANEICKAAMELPDLNKDTYSAWWEVAKRLMAFQYGESFEDHDNFEHFRHDEVIKKKGLNLERWFLRDFINKKLQRGFFAIARKPKPAD